MQFNKFLFTTSAQFIGPRDIDINSARTHSTAQKIFGQVNHLWDGPRFTSYVGFGAEVDFGRHPGPTPEAFEEEFINCASHIGVFYSKTVFHFKTSQNMIVQILLFLLHRAKFEY